MGWTCSRIQRIYFVLVVCRVCFALVGTGYIHPDEFFQNGEVTAGHAFGLHTLRTWEWDPRSPCRSIIPPFLTTGAPYFALNYLSRVSVSPRILFCLERGVFLGLSFILDYCTVQLVPNQEARAYALILLASSYVTHTFQARPFSNSIEAIIVVLYLVTFRNLLASPHASTHRSHKKSHLALLASLFVVGVFTRLTFVAFAIPVAFGILRWTWRSSPTGSHSPGSWLRCTFPAILSASLTALGFILTDTAYFHGALSNPVLTPLNFLLYNLDASNLAEHGLHPRWLHAVVNLPMIIGPGLLFFVVLAGAETFKVLLTRNKSQPGIVEQMQRMYTYMIMTALTLLSIQPHQEPRFLTPLLVPSIVLAAQSGYIQRAGRLFWVVWIISNVALAILFGVLHQGGIVPSLFRAHALLNESNALPTHVYYWKTYMPPRHLLAVHERDVLAGMISLTDLAGAPPSTLLDKLLARPIDNKHRTLLVAPPQAVHSLADRPSRCLRMQERVFPHLDLDNIPESLEAGWPDGLSLAIYAVDIKCLSAAPT